MSSNLTVATAIFASMIIFAGREKTRQHNSILSGPLYYRELMDSENHNRFLNAARMDRRTFTEFVEVLKQNGLRDSADDGGICAGQRVMILLHVLSGFSTRQCCERWQCSSRTVHTSVHVVINVLISCESLFFVAPKETDEVPEKVNSSAKFRPFTGCIGALDGTHIPATVGPALNQTFRNRKGQLTQNVLAVVNFDMIFSYCLCGWEGSAHDGRVLDDAKGKGLSFFINKYYLGDAGYALTPYCLTPYRGVRYHLKEWGRSGERPRSKEELFNLRHASLRNIIERAFGVLKKRFPILVRMPSYDITTQCKLVKCCMMIHNFIRLNALYEDAFYEWNQEIDGENDADVIATMQPTAPRQVARWRDEIAQQLWAQYQETLNNRATVNA